MPGTGAAPKPAPKPATPSQPATPPPSGPVQGGLAAGSLLPDFELFDIDGNRFRRSLLPGKRSVIVFLNIAEPGSKAVVEALRPQGSKTRALPKLIYIFDGGPTEAQIRSFVGKLPRQATVLVQEETEVATVLRVGGTPAAYVLDDQCVSQGALRVGATAVLEALGFAANSMPASAKKAGAAVPHAMVGARTFTGLAAGSAAPDVTLPLVSGGTWSPGDSAGRRQLVLFWDPVCPPCEDWLPSFAAASRGWSGFDAVVISRGDASANAALANAGVTLPVALQTMREGSRAFQVLDTPAAVEIDANGAIAGPPAVGGAAIAALATRMSQGG